MMTRVEYTTLIGQIKFKASMLRSSLCDHSDAHKLVSGTVTITGAGNDDTAR